MATKPVDPQEVDAIVEILLKTNEPPSDNQRYRIATGLRTLQDGAQRIGDQSSNQEGLPQDIEKCRRAVQDYQRALSCVRTLPGEIWHAVFEAGISGSWSCDDKYLQLICGICRRWRDLALSHCTLWARLPPIEHPRVFGGNLPPLSSMIQEEVIIRRYLSRSGAVPISFDFRIFLEAWKDPYMKALIQNTLLPLLIDQCHRWGSIYIYLPEQAFDEWLHPVSGKLCMLRTATLCVGDNPISSEAQEEGADTRTKIDCFKEAPMLRNIEVLTASFTGAILNVALPFSQLENFKIISGPDTCSEDLLTSRPSQLRTMDISRYSTPPNSLPASSLSFQHLTRLRLYTTERTLSIFRILDILVLPTLSALHIAGEFDFDAARPLFSKILLLIQHSGCSMKTLTVLAPLDTQQEDFYEILSLSPDLQHLEVPHIDAQGIQKLVLAMGDVPRRQLIPNLRVLKLCWYGSDHKNPSTGVIDVTMLRAMVVSRTTGERAFLDQVHLSNYHTLDQSAQLDSLWNPTAMGAEAVDALALAFLARTFEESLGYFYQYRFWNRSRSSPLYQRSLHALTCADVSLHERLDQEMRELENVNLAHHTDSLVLARRNVLYLLHEISQLEAGIIPGDDRFAFRVRAGEVCQKWKPFILRDARATRYAWRYVDPSLSVLTCRPVAEDKERTWKDIISRCNP